MPTDLPQAPAPGVTGWLAAVRARYGWRLLLVTVAVTLAHLLLTRAALDHLQQLSSGAPPEPPRLEAHYVAEVRVRTPPPPPTPAAAPTPPPRPARAALAAEPASQPASQPASATERAPAEPAADDPAAAEDPAASEPAAADTPLAGVPGGEAGPDAGPDAASDLTAQDLAVAEPAASSAPAAQDDAVSTASEQASQAASEPQPMLTEKLFGFDWPVATRIRYKLQGHFRGELHGHAEVEWIRQGLDYQVHVETVVAALFSRRIRSDGAITEQGLAPRLFSEEQKAVFATLKQRRIVFGPEVVVLAGGERFPTEPGLQDEASQFVQLTYLFTRQPELLQPGRVLSLPMVHARSRRLKPHPYEVQAPETLDTPLGPVQALRLVPQPDPERAGKGDWILEMWFSPELAYLPVRLRMRRDAPGDAAYADLVIDRAPQRAAAPGP